MITVDNKYKLGELVYLKTDIDQSQRMVTGLKVCLTNETLYELSCGTYVSWHYEFELSREKKIM
jgi:hypothetical protein